MKRIITVFLCLILCAAAAFAENAEKTEVETVGGKITLTQYLDVPREDAKSVAISVTTDAAASEPAYVNKDIFYNISDNFMLTSSFFPEPLTKEGIYITVEKNDGSFSYAYIGQSGGVDKYGAFMSRIPYGLYTSDDSFRTNELIALVKPTITVNDALAVTVNGEKLVFAWQTFTDINGRTLVSAREFCNYIHKNMDWSENSQCVTIYPLSDTALTPGGENDAVIFRIGEKKYEINGISYEIDTTAQLIGNTVYVPLRTLAELLGYHVMYVPSANG